MIPGGASAASSMRGTVAAAGFEIATADFEGAVYGTYTCVRA